MRKGWREQSAENVVADCARSCAAGERCRAPRGSKNAAVGGSGRARSGADSVVADRARAREGNGAAGRRRLRALARERRETAAGRSAAIRHRPRPFARGRRRARERAAGLRQPRRPATFQRARGVVEEISSASRRSRVRLRGAPAAGTELLDTDCPETLQNAPDHRGGRAESERAEN